MARTLYKGLLTFLLCFSISLPVMAADRTILEVQHKHDIKVVYDVNQNNMEAGIGQALYYVRGLLEAYKGQGIPMKQLHISVVVHGAAGYWLLKDPKYQDFVGNPFDVNPNEKVVNELIEHGVSVEICHVTMKAHRWKPEDILPGV
ncbi:DsrE family protein, partial [Hydrogenovibrio marinus]